MKYALAFSYIVSRILKWEIPLYSARYVVWLFHSHLIFPFSLFQSSFCPLCSVFVVGVCLNESSTCDYDSVCVLCQ